MTTAAKHLKVLEVSASARRTGSVSRQWSAAVIEGLKEAGSEISLKVRDLADGVPLIDEAWIAANFTPPEQRTDAQAAALSLSDRLIAELQEADLIVIGAPVYNFSIPASLKAWIDLVTRARVTFQYTEKGPEGLLKGKRAVIVVASGGVKPGSPADFATGYLKFLLAFIGVTDVSIIAADQLAYDADGAAKRAASDLSSALSSLLAPLERAA